MAQAYYHAKSSARKFGGQPEDYISLHRWLDQTKTLLPDARHRMILHNTLGISLAVQTFGDTIELTSVPGKRVPVQTICEQHIIEDFGYIPTVEKCFARMPVEPWMAMGAKALSRET